MNLIGEETMEKIAQSAWIKIWTIVSSFGTISVGLIGIMIIIRGIKLIIDTIIHGYALYTVFGWSLHLIRSVWDSTNLLLHLSKRQPAAQHEALHEPADPKPSAQPSITKSKPNTKQGNSTTDSETTVY